MYTFNVRSVPSCVSKVFLEQDDRNCTYKSLKQSIDAYNILDYGLIMFSAFGVKVELKCANYSSYAKLKGSYLLVPPKNCSMFSSLFKFFNNSQDSTLTLKHFVPQILWCSKYFKIDNISNFEDHLILDSFHDIKKINADTVTSQINNWKFFEKVNFNGHINTWHLTTTSLIIIMIIVLIIYAKCSNLLCKKGSNITVNYATEPLPESQMTNGYPSF